LGSRKSIGCVGFFESFEDANDLLHASILQFPRVVLADIEESIDVDGFVPACLQEFAGREVAVR